MDEIQYSVVLMGKEGEFFRGYVWVDKKSIEHAVEVSKMGCSCDLISGGRGFLVGERCVVGIDGSSLEFFAKDEKDANDFAVNYFKLPEPFLKKNGDYVLNRFGE